MHGSPTGGSVPRSGEIEGDGDATGRFRSRAALRRCMLTIITKITLLQGKETHLAAMYHRRGVGAGCCSGAVTSAYAG